MNTRNGPRMSRVRHLPPLYAITWEATGEASDEKLFGAVEVFGGLELA